MWVRLTFVKIKPEKLDECRRIMIDEIIPIVKAQKGNIDCCLLESVDEKGDAISYSSWESKEDGDAYEASGTYEEMVNMVRHTHVGPTTLKTYEDKR